ncbi:hypothetical protein AMECASPLE_018828 [Ameca splendens]|uniref:Uncharacterized protein n=1 Tax=Ameca splendens TaxID=208324 RepID=A0ABV1ABE2_9TELE
MVSNGIFQIAGMTKHHITVIYLVMLLHANDKHTHFSVTIKSYNNNIFEAKANINLKVTFAKFHSFSSRSYLVPSYEIGFVQEAIITGNETALSPGTQVSQASS